MTDLGDFESVMYNVQPEGFYTIATSEHPNGDVMDEVIEPSLLPIKMVGVSPCFRRGFGAHGQGDKGIWRVHQSAKGRTNHYLSSRSVLGGARRVAGQLKDPWDSLGLHYEVVNICTGDMGIVASKKYDLEFLLPDEANTKKSKSVQIVPITKRIGSECAIEQPMVMPLRLH